MNHSKRPFIIANSEVLTTTQVEEEIIPNQPNGEPYPFYSFDFINEEECMVSVNESEFFRLGANQGLRFGIHDPIIYSFIIKEEGITYNFIGGY